MAKDVHVLNGGGGGGAPSPNGGTPGGGWQGGSTPPYQDPGDRPELVGAPPDPEPETAPEPVAAPAEVAPVVSVSGYAAVRDVPLPDDDLAVVEALLAGAPQPQVSDTPEVPSEPSDAFTPLDVKTNVYTLSTQRGNKTMVAVSEEQAREKAALYGLEVSGVVSVEEVTLSLHEAQRRAQEAGQKGSIHVAHALIAYGMLPPDTTPIRDGTGEIVMMSRDAWETLPEPYKEIMLTEGLENLKSAIVAEMPPEYRTIAETEGFEVASLRCSQDIEVAQGALAQIKDFALSKGVSSDDFVSLYYAGLNFDTLRMAYPGNDEYFAEMKTTLEALKPYVDVQPTPGVYMAALGTPTLRTHAPNLVAALVAGNVSVGDLKQLGYDPGYVDACGDAAASISSIIAKFDEGVQIRGEGLSQGLGLTGSEMADLGSAFLEAGIEHGGVAVHAWREVLTTEEKFKVAQVLVSYPSLGHPVVSLHRELTAMGSVEQAPMALKVGVSVASAPLLVVTTPFVKNITVGEIREQLEPYASYNPDGTVKDFDVTQYLTDKPHDSPLLVRSGFSLEDVEKAQKGEQVDAMPQGATTLDWLLFGTVVASVGLPLIRGGTMALFGPKGPLHAVTAGHFKRAFAGALVYKGAALGETAIKIGFPVGMVTADIIGWKDWTPEQRVVAGIFTGLSLIPVAGALFRMGRTGVQYVKAATAKVPAVPSRALTTGYYDLYPITTPRNFFTGVSSEMRAQIDTIMHSKMSGAEKSVAITKLLPQDTQPAFQATVAAGTDLKVYSAPPKYWSTLVDVYSRVPGMNPATAQSLINYLAQQPDIVVGGSVAMNANGLKGIAMHDFDIVTTGGDARRVQLSREITRLIGSEVSKDVKTATYPTKPYDLSKGAAEPVVIEGIKHVSVGDLIGNAISTVASPGLEGGMGPGVPTLERRDFPEVRVGTHEGRAPDYYKLKIMVEQVVDQLKAQGDTPRALQLEGYMKTYEDWLRKLEVGELEPLPPGEAERIRADVLELVKEAQYQLLEQGKDVAVLDPRGKMVIAVAASPANVLIPGALIMGTPNISPNIEMANVQGKFKPVDGMVFLSPKAAGTYTLDKVTGRLGENPGFNIILTVPSVDIGPGGIIEGPFRYEYLEQAFEGEIPVIYDELVTGGEFLPTPKTAMSYELGVETGVVMILDSASGKTLPALVWRTEAAATKGLTVPSQAETLALTRLALKSAIRSLVKPHMRDITFSAISPQRRAGLFWFGDKPYDLRKATLDDLRNATRIEVGGVVDQAVARLEEQGKSLTEKNILEEAQSILEESVDAEMKRAQTTGVPLTITKGMRARLQSLGHSDKSIDTMTPQGAWSILMAEGRLPVPSVEEAGSIRRDVGELLGGLDPQSRTEASRRAVVEYEKAVEVVIKDWESGTVPFDTTSRRLYYLNLGLLSLRVAEAALVTSLLTAKTPSGSTLFVPAVSLTPSVGVSEALPSIIALPTTSLIPETPVTTSVTTPVTTPIKTPITTPAITPITTPTTPPTTPPPPPPPPPPPTPPRRPPPPLPPGGVDQLKEAYERGTPILLWRQGALGGKDVWKAVINPEKQKNLLTVVGTEKLPFSPRKYATGVGSAQATMQWIGRGPRHEGSADLGVVDIHWGPKGEDLKFVGKGLETVVGERIPSTTIGISIPEASRLKFGTTFAEALAYVPKDDAQREFIEERIQGMLSEMSSEEIAQCLKDSDLSDKRVEEILMYVPDQQRSVVRVLLKPTQYVKVGQGFKFAETSILDTDEKDALYTEEELKQERLEALSKVQTAAPRAGERETAEFLLEVKGL